MAWSNTRRSILTMAAIAFACLLLVFMLSWQFGSYDTMINSAVKIHTGHLQIQAKGYQDRRSIRLVVPDPARVGEVLEGIPGVDEYTFRANAFSLVSSRDRTYGIMVTGIDPGREAKVSTIKYLIRKGKYLSDSDINKALIGEFLAKILKVTLGDELVVLGQGRDGSVAATVMTVEGIFSSGQDAFDRSSIQINIADEPTANLDSKTGNGLLEMMSKMNEEKKVTLIFSTHDRMIMDYARRLILIRDGLVADDDIRKA